MQQINTISGCPTISHNCISGFLFFNFEMHFIYWKSFVQDKKNGFNKLKANKLRPLNTCKVHVTFRVFLYCDSQYLALNVVNFFDPDVSQEHSNCS